MTGLDIIAKLRDRQVKAANPPPARKERKGKHAPAKPGETEEEQKAREASGLIG